VTSAARPGCLTEADFHKLERMAPGRAPAELAAHVAACARCQQQMLARGSGSTPRAATRPWSRVWLLLLLLALIVLPLVALVLARSRLSQ
jgi:hypothetical protein